MTIILQILFIINNYFTTITCFNNNNKAIFHLFYNISYLTIILK